MQRPDHPPGGYWQQTRSSVRREWGDYSACNYYSMADAVEEMHIALRNGFECRWHPELFEDLG